MASRNSVRVRSNVPGPTLRRTMKSRTVDVIILFPPLSAKNPAHCKIVYINRNCPATDLCRGADVDALANLRARPDEGVGIHQRAIADAICDRLVNHAVLLELLTDHGAGTLIKR